MRNLKTFSEFLNEGLEKKEKKKVGIVNVTIQHGDYINGDGEGMFVGSIGNVTDVESYMRPPEEYEWITKDGNKNGDIKDTKSYLATITKMLSAAVKPSGEIKNPQAFEKLKNEIDNPPALFGGETYNGWTNGEGEYVESEQDYIETACYIVAKSTLYIDWVEKYKD